MVRCIGIVLWVPEEYATAQELADDLHRFLADMLPKQRQGEEAQKLHEEVLGRRRKVLGQDHPDTVASMNGRAWILATCDDARQRDPARPVELATQVTTLAPQQADIWNTLGVARYRAGDCKGAREGLQRSMELRQGGLLLFPPV